jgi:plasmid stability protein
MSKMVQIRNVPDSLHRRLKARAALEGLSLSEFLLREIREFMEKPATGELRARLDSQSRVKLRSSVVEILREARESR